MEIKQFALGIAQKFSKEFDKKYMLFLLACFVCLLVKFIIFTKTATGTLTLSSGMESDFGNMVLGYSIYVGIALVIISLGLFSKKFWPSFALFIINDIWILANLVSLRSHGIMINGYDFRIASNMNGFWDSVFAFMYFSDLLLFISTAALMVYYYKFLKNDSRKIALGVCLLILGGYITMIKPLRFDKMWGIPANFLKAVNVDGSGRPEYAADYTIFSNLLAEIKFYFELDGIPKRKELSVDEQREIRQFMIHPQEEDSIQSNVVIIMVESMEGWTMNKKINDQEITPSINSLTTQNAIFGTCMNSETQRGTSSDAQLLVNTGLLPLIYEAVCFAYPQNKYYSIGDAMAQLGSHNVMLIPTNASSWNQSKISGPWGFPTLYSHEYSDEELFNDVAEVFDTIQEPFCIHTVTMASHAPFWKYAGESDLNIPEGLPAQKENYIRSLNYTDRCIGDFIKKAKKSPKFERTTFLILGDHSIFGSSRSEFGESEIGRSLGAAENGMIPFVIYSPKMISQSKEIKDTVYQMDIYPTLLNVLKLDNYPWRGLGCDLTKDSITRNYTEHQLSDMSENIIRSDFFNKKK